MPLVATIICNPLNPVLDDALARRLHSLLGAGESIWLAEGVALDIVLPDSMSAGLAESLLREALTGLPVDLAVQQAEQRRRKALIADMDSTMIEQECIDELAAGIGVGEKVAEITRRAMNGEIEFEPALRERVALLAGHPVTLIDRVLAERISLAPGAAQLVATMRAHACYTVLVSGGFDSFTSRIASALGFHEHRANRLEVRNGVFTGRVIEPILGRRAKVDALHAVAISQKIAPADFIAVGDGANDLDMLALAGAGVAMHAKPVVAEKARLRIDHGDLTALLYLQGYRRAQFSSV